ncbi:hypothetical protein GJAV_G00141130, partial [Gymnothorax javanicus]
MVSAAQCEALMHPVYSISLLTVEEEALFAEDCRVSVVPAVIRSSDHSPELQFAEQCRNGHERITLWELHFCTPLSSRMLQAGVCLRQDTETTLPELTEQHRIRQKEEELSGLESVHMAESETECAAPGLNTLEPECVTAHSGVRDVHHTHTSLIKTETDLGSTHSGDLIKMESLDSTELGYVTHLHPDQIKTETDDGGYLKVECRNILQDTQCIKTE